MSRPLAYQSLWALACELAPQFERGRTHGPSLVFDCSEVGLILEQSEGSYGGYPTPLHADTFAHTGGDGVHFSILAVECAVDDRPIVMTVPAAGERCNVIVGSCFMEFMELGCTFGYFALEDIVYQREVAIDRIQSGRHAYEDCENGKLLSLLRDRLQLRPWPNVRHRLTELQSKFSGLIIVPKVDED